MLNTLLLGLLYSGLRIRGLLITILHKDFITTQVLAGLCLAPLYFLMGEPLAAFPLAVFSIMFLIQGVACLITMMRTYGWQAQVEVSAGIGVTLGVMVLGLLAAASLLDLSRSCML